MDPPSSPPIVRSLSPNTHDQPKPTKSTGNERKETENPKGATASKNSTVSISTPVTIRKQDKDADGSKQNSKTNKRSTARPRSASGRFIKSPKLREPDPSPSKEPRDPDRTQSAKSDLGETASASKSAPRNKKSRVQCSESRAANENDSGDDIETQIASQLGQDLELAVDSDEVVNAEESELPSTYSMTKKRKREVEQTHAPPAKERRRSSRRLSNMDSTEDAQIRTIRTRSSTLARPTDPATKPSPVGPGPKKRKGRSEKTTGDLVPPKPADGHAQDDQATPADQTQSTEGGVESTKSSEPIQKRRKSSRLGGHTDSQGSEDTPVQAKLPPSRSRKRGTKGKKGRSSLQKAKESSAEETTQTSDLDKHGIDGTSSDNITQGRSEDPSQSSEELPDAQTNTPDPQTERSPIQEDSQPQDPETGTDNGTNQQGDPTDSQGRQAENDKDDAAILRSLRGVLDDVKAASMNMDTLKEMDNLLFEIRVQAHDALRRQSR